MKLTFRQRLMASTLLIGAASVASPAWAQSQDATSETPITSAADPDAGSQDPGAEGQAGEGEEVVITGSRIPRRDLTSTSPLAVVQDEEFALSGAVNVEQVINTLPQVIPGISAFSNNPGGGVATLNLRGLGEQRNLVLVNGRRYIFYDANQIVDLNTIPSFLLDSVDVVTGGASAVYGSDALAGVTNFRLRTDLNGLLVGGQYGITEEGDGQRYNIYGAIGTTFADGRGFVSAYGEYYKRGSIFQSARDFSRFTFSDSGGVLVPGGSAGVPQGRVQAIGGTSVGAGTSFAGLGSFFASPGEGRAFVSGPDSYNYAPSNYLMVPQTRYTLGGYGEYEIAEGVRGYGEVTFINNLVPTQLAPTPITQRVNIPLSQLCGPGAVQPVSAANCAELLIIQERQQALIAGGSTAFGAFNAGAGSFNATQPNEVALTINTRFAQISARENVDERNAFRILGGVRGEIAEGLNYDIFYLRGATKNAQVQRGNVSRSAFVTNVENGTCNPFGLNQFSEACIENISILAQNQEESILQVAQGSISGSLFQLPWANEGVGFSAGLEYRKMSAEFIPDTALSSGDVAGFNAGDPTEGAYDVKEVFGELRVPIVQDSFIHRFELNAAGRWSKYSLEAVGGVPTYSVGAELSPIQDISFRAQYQRAVRAPNVQELFGGSSISFPAATDPCSNRTTLANQTEALRQACIANGVPAANVFTGPIQANDQIEALVGGNPNLQEEVGDTLTAGVILRPRFIPRLNLAVDYYDIKIDGVITSGFGGVQATLNLCLNDFAGSPSAAACQAIIRDPTGAISGGGEFIVLAGNLNLAELHSRGIDAQADYSLPLNFGLFGQNSRLNMFILGSYTMISDVTPIAGLDVIECAGRFGLDCGDPTPKWKHTARLSFMDGPLTTSLRWRYIGKTKDDDEETDFVLDRIKAANYFDLAFSANVSDNATMNFGINNLFDKKPPIGGGNVEQANTYPGTFDVLGRDFFVSVAFRL
jgi:outer membrane receptor protein involved in Fe transport